MQATQDHATTTTGPNLAPLFIPGVTRGSLPVGLLPPLDMPLTFLPQPSPSRAGKRSRAAADIDGEHSCLQKKKRRLRLLLITSRLSPQFSHPATNIVDRGSSKIAVWAKQKALGRNLLRKAAILNRIRRQTIASSRGRGSRDSRSPVQQEKEREQLQLAKLEFDHGAIDTYTRPVHSTTHSVPPTAAVRTGKHFIVSASPSSSPSPSPTSSSPPLKAKPEKSTSTPTYRSPNAAYAFSPQRAQASCRDHSPLPPSPLGLSNYDAFDREGGPNRYNRFDDDDDELQFLIPYNDDDGDDDDVPFSPSAATSTSITMAAKSTDQAIPSPLLPLSPNLKPLDPNDSVFGAYDRVDDSVDETWPTIISPPQVQPLPALTNGRVMDKEHGFFCRVTEPWPEDSEASFSIYLYVDYEIAIYDAKPKFELEPPRNYSNFTISQLHIDDYISINIDINIDIKTNSPTPSNMPMPTPKYKLHAQRHRHCVSAQSSRQRRGLGCTIAVWS
ncbi:predicted protein [Plenodomus lingam JN3]|uniref:Predicted protein n=1 Tax=Leptosphaeria maculans (strain JN3 / isolate v23.1.3 / race Av1-4-5-6-7-8) TaxID=985895 RepID=E4ZZ19_LEPMJ|nr:predicted protein [Plenodomus lingam JN3]CBX96454.1 predicted protein [Plenodomus lingam JN3]